MDETRHIVAEAELAKSATHEEIIRQVKALTSGDGYVADSTSPKQPRRPFDVPPSKEQIAELRTGIDRESRQRAKR